MFARILLYLLASALIAAHFLRAGSYLPALLCLAAPLLFLLRRRWSLLLLQGLAYAAAGGWLWIAWELALQRRSYGRPWLAAVTILVAVAGLSALAGVLLRQPRLQERYRR